MPRRYHIDPYKITLDQLQASLEKRRVIPSRAVLKEALEERFQVLGRAGVETMGDLIARLKSKPKLEAFAHETGLDPKYLTVLKREASSYLPNPTKLDRFPGVNEHVIAELRRIGINNSKQLFDRTLNDAERQALRSETDISDAAFRELVSLADLSRLYGVGPFFARILYDTGIDSVNSFVSHSAKEIVELYEQTQGKKADFTEGDIQFSLEIAMWYWDLTGEEPSD